MGRVRCDGPSQGLVRRSRFARARAISNAPAPSAAEAVRAGPRRFAPLEPSSLGWPLEREGLLEREWPLELEGSLVLDALLVGEPEPVPPGFDGEPEVSGVISTSTSTPEAAWNE